MAFLRTRIEFIGAFFGPSEVSEIWLTFSDPQLRGSENARLSSPMFLERYRGFLRPGGLIHLKTDSRYLYEYTQAVCKVNNLNVLAYGTDVYREGIHILEPSAAPTPPTSWAPPSYPAEGGQRFQDMYPLSAEEVTSVQTFYEKMFLEMGLPITYMAFMLEHEGAFVGPGEAFNHDYWLEQEGPRRSFSHQPNKKQ